VASQGAGTGAGARVTHLIAALQGAVSVADIQTARKFNLQWAYEADRDECALR
jgi:hypothetical protein